MATQDTNAWTCETCEAKPQFEKQTDFIDHLVAVHQAPGPENIKGTKRMLAHIDGRDWFGGSDEWTFDFGQGEVKAVNSYRQKRSRESQMYWD